VGLGRGQFNTPFGSNAEVRLTLSWALDIGWLHLLLPTELLQTDLNVSFYLLLLDRMLQFGRHFLSLRCGRQSPGFSIMWYAQLMKLEGMMTEVPFREISKVTLFSPKLFAFGIFKQQ